MVKNPNQNPIAKNFIKIPTKNNCTKPQLRTTIKDPLTININVEA